VRNKPERGIGETHSAIGACLRRQAPMAEWVSPIPLSGLFLTSE